jgi:hypothetical protein
MFEERLGRRGRLVEHPVWEAKSIKLVPSVLGVIRLIVAVVYFLTPADQLPGFSRGTRPA